jgi:hypothetical protein
VQGRQAIGGRLVVGAMDGVDRRVRVEVVQGRRGWRGGRCDAGRELEDCLGVELVRQPYFVIFGVAA